MAVAKERDGRMLSSAAEMLERARNIIAVRYKILAAMADVDRRNYPPYEMRNTEQGPNANFRGAQIPTGSSANNVCPS
jgi:hypothetical protein